MTANTFHVGDVVQLKSGGPVMTVHTIGDFTWSAGPNPGVLCIWFDGTKRIEGVFDPRTLMLYKSMP